MKKLKWALLGILAVATVAFAADKYISSSGNIVLKTAASKSVNLQDTLYATQAGKVGIGSTDPSTLFQVGSNAVSDNALTVMSQNNTAASVKLRGDLSGGAGFDLTYMGAGNYAKFSSIHPTAGEVEVIRAALFTATATGPFLAIDGTGKVGVGTTSPSVKLHVNRTDGDNAIAEFQTNHASAGTIDIRNGGGVGRVGTTNSGIFLDAGADGVDLSILSSGATYAGANSVLKRHGQINAGVMTDLLTSTTFGSNILPSSGTCGIFTIVMHSTGTVGRACFGEYLACAYSTTAGWGVLLRHAELNGCSTSWEVTTSGSTSGYHTLNLNSTGTTWELRFKPNGDNYKVAWTFTNLTS